MLEEQFLLKCSRCFASNEDMRITHIDGDGNLYCVRCAAYLRKIGGYDLKNFNVNEFINKDNS